MFKRNLTWLMLVMLVPGVFLGCSAGETAHENPPAKVVGKEVIPLRSTDNPDLAGYPMPTELIGKENLPGLVTWTNFKPKTQVGTLVFTVDQDTLNVVAQGVVINCCTERLDASYAQDEAGVEIMVYEYLPDVCECFHKRNLQFSIYPVPAAGTMMVVRCNDRMTIQAAGQMP